MSKRQPMLNHSGPDNDHNDFLIFIVTIVVVSFLCYVLS